MDRTFDIRRFGRYLAWDLRNARNNAGFSLLVYGVTPIFIFAFFQICSLVFNGGTSPFGLTPRLVCIFALIVLSAMMLPSRLYGRVTDRRYGTEFLMLPASTFEKFISMVIVTAVMGVNVLVVLTLGIVSAGIIGIAAGTMSPVDWSVAMGSGMASMGELIIITMMAGGMLEMIRLGGGIDYIISRLTARIRSRRGAEAAIASLAVFADICTANNTVAIISVGTISRNIAHRFGIPPRRAASLLDTFSCFVQGIIPYGAQLLMAAGLASVSPVQIIPYLYYPFIMGCCAVLAIILQRPRYRD